MAQDLFASSPEIDIRKRWATRQLENASDTSAAPPLAAAARALQGLFGGYIANKAEEEDKAAGAAMFGGLPGLNAAQPAPSGVPMPPGATPSQPMPLPASGASLPRGLRNNNPLNIEAGGFTQGQPGYQGSDGRFARFDTPDAGVNAAGKLLDTYQNKYGLNTVNGIIGRWAPSSENDTRGYAASVAGRMGVSPDAPLTPEMRPKLIAAMAQFENGRPLPQGPGAYQVAGPAVAPPGTPQQQPGASPPAAPAAPAAMPPGAPPTNPAAAPPVGPVPNRSQVQIPPEVAATVQRLGADPRTRGQAWQLYLQYAKPVESIQPMSADQRKQWQIPDGMSAGIDTVTGKPVFSPPQTNVNLNTAQKGQEVMATEAAKDFKTAQESGRDAAKRTQVWDTMEQASKGFTPGATADVKLQAKRYLKDLGVIEGGDVPDAEVFKQMQQQLAIHAQPKGQGAVSNFERDMYAKSIANMTMSPEALSRAIQMGRKLDEFDRKVAQVYRDNARKNNGVPNSIDINDDIDKLGSPLSPSEMNYLRKGAEGKPAAASPAAPSGVDPAALEEARRRGLIK